MIKVKICGITRIEDAKIAASMGAWAVGFIFVKNTPRYIEPDKAASIIRQLPENIEKIGVFSNSAHSEIKDYSLKSGITRIQMHGEESAEFCENILNSINLPVIKSIRINNKSDIEIISAYKNFISAILLDSFSETIPGGTGKTFNWDIAKKAGQFEIPIILAGGINPENAKQAYLKVSPYALDISSGVEKEKGIKDLNKLKSLFSNIAQL